MATDFTSQINGWYQSVQYRNGPTADVLVYNANLQSGALTAAQVQAGIIGDTYTTNYVNPVIREYQAALGRVPDQAGAAFWVGAFAAGISTATLATTFANSAEFTARFGATPTTPANVALVTAIYTNVYGRTPDPAGLAFWSTSGLSAARLLDAFANAPEFVTATAAAVTAFEQLEIAGTAPTTGSLFNLGGSQNVGTTFALTTNADVVAGTANNDTITGFFNTTDGATDSTLTAADTINGGAGTDSLKMTVSGAAVVGSLPADAITNVENFYIRDVNTFGTSTYDFSPLTGVQQVWSDRSSQWVIFDKLASGTTVGLQGNNAATLGNVTANYVGTATSAALAIDGGVGPVGTTAPVVAITGAAVTSESITSTGAANKIGTLGLTATTTSVTLDATTALTTGAITAAGLQTLTVKGAGAVDISAGALSTTVIKIDASASTGGLNVKVGATGLTTFTGGTGNDTLVGSAAASATGNFDGGAGTDTVSALMINAGNAAQFKSFEQIDLAGFVTGASDTLDTSLMTASTSITGAVISAAVGGANTATLSNIVDTASGFNAFVTDISGTATGTTKLSFTSASVSGTSDIVNVGFKAVDQVAATTSAAGIISASKIETFNIASNGGLNISNSITITDDDLKTINITGNKDLTLAVTGQKASVVSTIATQLTTVDGSAATGKLTITLNNADATISQAAVALKGGSGDDTFTLVTSATGSNVGSSTSFTGPTVTGGAGNDTFVVTGATARSTSSPGFVTITDFSKGDVLKDDHMTAFNATKIDVSVASTLVDALNIATAATNTALKSSWFQYGGNTYVVSDDAGTGVLSTADVVVKMTGVLDLSTSTYAANAITFV